MENSSGDMFEALHNNWTAEGQKGEISVDEDPEMKKLKLKMISRQEDARIAFSYMGMLLVLLKLISWSLKKLLRGPG